MNIIEACQTAYDFTGNIKWFHYAQKCLEWFIGRNDLNVSLYDCITGGCCDGLTPKGPNRNQGAESTLSWLISLLTIYKMKSEMTFKEPDSTRDSDFENLNRGYTYEYFDK